MAKSKANRKGVQKIETGFRGFDAMTLGGLPRGRVSVIRGGAGTGKTLFAMQTLCHWLSDTSRVGIFVSFEEGRNNIESNFAVFDWWQAPFSKDRLLLVDARWRTDVIQSGSFDLSGLLAAVEGVIGQNQANFLVLDGIDVLLNMMPDPLDARRELLRLQHWTEALALTTLVTMKGHAPLEGQSGRGFLEDLATYMADCVLELDRDSFHGIAYRTLYIQKYRGSGHTQNKVPYTIGDQGIEIVPADASAGGFKVYTQRVSTGMADLDEMLGGGIFRGSTTLVTGAPGTTKTTFASGVAASASQRGEKVLYICFDEAPEEIVRNMKSVNIHLADAVKNHTLHMEGFVARSSGPDLLAGRTRQLLKEFQPRFLILDPVSAFTAIGSEELGYSAIRLITHEAKQRGVTVILTSLLDDVEQNKEKSKAHISTLADNWIHLSYVANAGERNRALTIVKSRGTAHSNQVRELILSSDGIWLKPVYTEKGEVLMGAMRWQREEEDRQQERRERLESERRYRSASREMTDIQSQIRELETALEKRRHDLESFELEVGLTGEEEKSRRQALAHIRTSRSSKQSASPKTRTNSRKKAPAAKKGGK
ncbi:circadian clock protein KaiC [Haliea sp.]